MRRRRPILLYLVIAAVGISVLVAAGLVVQVMREPKKPPAPKTPVAAQPQGRPTTDIGQAGTIPGLVGPLQTLSGTRQIGDFSVGFPHTPVGAVSAAAYYWSQLSSTLDVDRATTLVTLIADPTWTSAVPDIQHGRGEVRKDLGLPATGLTPEGASVLFTPLMYQVRAMQPDSMDVLLLGYYATSKPGQQPVNRRMLFPTKIRWVEGDWKLPDQDLAGDYAPLMATPGSDDALSRGWLPLNS